MKFGIFYEHQLPRPWTERSEYELLQNSLVQIELADKLGYDYAWEVEHHFLEEYSHSSAPEVFLAAASQRTKQIRLAHGIIQLTTNHPARVAERVSTLDLVSGGRVEFGMGEGSSITELHPFDRRFRDKRSVWEDAVKAIIPMFTHDAWEYHGEYFDFPRLKMCPVPSEPIRITVGGHSAPAVRRAARLGDGWVAANVTRDEMRGLVSMLDGYRKQFGSDRNRDFIVQGMLSDIEVFDPADYREAQDMGLSDITLSPWGVYETERLELSERLDRINRFGDEVLSKF